MAYRHFILAVMLVSVPVVVSASVLLPETRNDSSPARPNLGLAAPPPQKPSTEPTSKPVTQTPATTTPRRATTTPSRATTASPAVPPSRPMTGTINLSQEEMARLRQLSQRDLEAYAKGIPNEYRQMFFEQIEQTKRTGKVEMSDNEAESLTPRKIQLKPGGKIEAIKTSANTAQPATTTITNSAIREAVERQKQEREKRFTRPPTVISDSSVKNVNLKHLKNTISIELSGQYMWGQKDIKVLEDSLGYTAQTVPQNCQIRIDAVVNTDRTDGTHPGQIYAGQTEDVKYNGTITSVSLKPYAVCHAPKNLPQKGRIIRQTNDGKFAVSMPGRVECTPEGSSSYLMAQYGGDSKITCTFR